MLSPCYFFREKRNKCIETVSSVASHSASGGVASANCIALKLASRKRTERASIGAIC